MAFDLVLTGGRVIDPSQSIDRVTDVAFQGGKVVAVGDGLAAQAATVEHVEGKIVTPGLIDLHTHTYWGGTSLGVDPVILGELRYGILLLPKGRKRTSLETWFTAGTEKLLCLPWDRETGLRWAELLAALRKRGAPMPVKNSMIAATALAHGLTVVTRNTVDFAKAKVPTFNPFV